MWLTRTKGLRYKGGNYYELWKDKPYLHHLGFWCSDISLSIRIGRRRFSHVCTPFKLKVGEMVELEVEIKSERC